MIQFQTRRVGQGGIARLAAAEDHGGIPRRAGMEGIEILHAHHNLAHVAVPVRPPQHDALEEDLAAVGEGKDQVLLLRRQEKEPGTGIVLLAGRLRRSAGDQRLLRGPHRGKRIGNAHRRGDAVAEVVDGLHPQAAVVGQVIVAHEHRLGHRPQAHVLLSLLVGGAHDLPDHVVFLRVHGEVHVHIRLQQLLHPRPRLHGHAGHLADDLGGAKSDDGPPEPLVLRSFQGLAQQKLQLLHVLQRAVVHHAGGEIITVAAFDGSGRIAQIHFGKAELILIDLDQQRLAG